MIRRAREQDIPALRDIYNDAILHTTATFDTEEKSLADRRQWFSEHQGKYMIFVAEEAETVAGYVSLSRYRDRKAFDRSAELSVYVHREFRRQGVGRALMKAALAFAEEQPGLSVVVSLITGENEASIRLHRELGFIYCGELQGVGEKFGRLLDLRAYQKDCTKTEVTGAKREL